LESDKNFKKKKNDYRYIVAVDNETVREDLMEQIESVKKVIFCLFFIFIFFEREQFFLKNGQFFFNLTF